jgi:hydroxymethylbilane synthase
VKSNPVRIGSRGSALALWQARWVEQELHRHFPALETSIQIVKTTGDRVLDSPLTAIGGKGVFTKEIEEALLDGRCDLAVHSLKDVPTGIPDGLVIGAICEREDVRDVFIPHPSNPVRTLLDQRSGAHIATGSLRRRCQLLAARPDFQIIDIRGNLNTRMDKLGNSVWQGMILARAGVMRLGWADRIGETIPLNVILPAVGQGALAIELRSGDGETAALAAALAHEPTARATEAERALLKGLEGGCQVPIGAYGRWEDRNGDTPHLVLDAMVGSLDGNTIIRGSAHGEPERADVIGQNLAATLLAAGADRILKGIRTEGGPYEPA